MCNVHEPPRENRSKDPSEAQVSGCAASAIATQAHEESSTGSGAPPAPAPAPAMGPQRQPWDLKGLSQEDIVMPSTPDESETIHKLENQVKEINWSLKFVKWIGGFLSIAAMAFIGFESRRSNGSSGSRTRFSPSRKTPPSMRSDLKERNREIAGSLDRIEEVPGSQSVIPGQDAPVEGSLAAPVASLEAEQACRWIRQSIDEPDDRPEQDQRGRKPRRIRFVKVGRVTRPVPGDNPGHPPTHPNPHNRSHRFRDRLKRT